MQKAAVDQRYIDIHSQLPATDGFARPARIVHLVSALQDGGIERLLIAMAPYWDCTRFSVEVWCLNLGSRQTYLNILNDKGIRVRVLGRLDRERIELRVLWRMLTLTVRHSVAVIHTHTPYPLAVVMLVRLLLGPRVVHIHHQHNLPPRYQILPMYTLGRIRSPDHLIAVSEAMAADARVLLPHLSCPVSVILNGIELPNVNREMVDETLHHVFTAARLTAQKNIELLLLAMQKVLQKCPSATLTVLGDGELRCDLETKARLLGIDDRVSFVGYVLDPDLYYSKLGLFVLPSLWEPFGLALLEAMAWGKPCIATKIGGMRELIRDGENGLLVPSNDSDAMANAILKVIHDPALARRLGYVARQSAQEFDIRKTVAQIQHLYANHLNMAKVGSIIMGQE